jgi:hypothetical protein
MSHRISIALSWLGIISALLAAPIASAQHNAPPGGPAHRDEGTNPNSLTFCVTPPSAQRVIYFSSVAPVGAKVTQDDREASFAAFLQKKYGYRTSTSCAGITVSTPQAAEYVATDRQTRITNYRSAGYTVVETDWTYTPVTGTLAAPAPAAPRPTGIPGNSTATRNVTGTPSGGASAPGRRTDYATCWADSEKPTAYFSAAFPIGKHDYAAWIKAFTGVLAKQYGYAGAVRCFVHANLADAQSNLRARMNALRPTRQVVETGWSYAQGQSAAPSGQASPAVATAAAASRPAGIPGPTTPPHSATASPNGGAAAAPQALYAICWGKNREPSVYFSAPFEVSTRNPTPWLKAFRGVLQDKYGFAGEVLCDVQPSLAQAQKFLQRRVAAFRSTKQIVETAWKYE